jgi:excisionase family DNA binding protein
MPITPKQLAEKTSVDVSYIQRLCREGRINASKPGGRDWLIPEEEAERWLREHQRKKTRIQG